MIHVTLAERYAQALFESVEPHAWDAVLGEISALKRILFQESDAYKILALPNVSLVKKKEVITAVLRSCECMPVVESFVSVVLSQGRMSVFPLMVEVFHELIQKARGMKTARVRVSHAISDDERHKLLECLCRLSGKQLECEIIHDPSLVCGVSAEVGNVIYDCSVKHKLEKLMRELHSHA